MVHRDMYKLTLLIHIRLINETIDFAYVTELVLLYNSLSACTRLFAKMALLITFQLAPFLYWHRS